VFDFSAKRHFVELKQLNTIINSFVGKRFWVGGFFLLEAHVLILFPFKLRKVKNRKRKDYILWQWSMVLLCSFHKYLKTEKPE